MINNSLPLQSDTIDRPTIEEIIDGTVERHKDFLFLLQNMDGPLSGALEGDSQEIPVAYASICREKSSKGKYVGNPRWLASFQGEDISFKFRVNHVSVDNADRKFVFTIIDTSDDEREATTSEQLKAAQLLDRSIKEYYQQREQREMKKTPVRFIKPGFLQIFKRKSK